MFDWRAIQARLQPQRLARRRLLQFTPLRVCLYSRLILNVISNEDIYVDYPNGNTVIYVNCVHVLGMRPG